MMVIETKTLWQSRTFWVNAVAMIFSLLAAFKVALPEGLTQEEAVSMIMGVVGALNIALRVLTSKPIG
ncbi:hypothetical protein PX699_28155 [Sphingobium sp. H39-3-25]|uniref:hypothetical protein n=1 Tax=Sphingobium arseniciresistens TaxID=3030834 RepID=UPI0023B9677B|nr:hypothetical protein [Sphingobium arseniciresistens]